MRTRRAFLYSVSSLVVLWLLVEAWSAREIAERAEDYEGWKARTRAEIEGEVQASLEALERELSSRLEGLPEDPAILEALARREPSIRGNAFDRLIERTASRPDEKLGLALLDGEGRALAWAGWIPFLEFPPAVGAAPEGPVVLTARTHEVLAVARPTTGGEGRLVATRPIHLRYPVLGSSVWSREAAEAASARHDLPVEVEVGGPQAGLNLELGDVPIGSVEIVFPERTRAVEAMEARQSALRRGSLALLASAIAFWAGFAIMRSRAPRFLRALGATVLVVGLRWLLLAWQVPEVLLGEPYFGFEYYTSTIGADLPSLVLDPAPAIETVRIEPFRTLGDLLLTSFFLLLELFLLAHLLLPLLRVQGLTRLGRLFRSAADPPLDDESTQHRRFLRPARPGVVALAVLASPVAALVSVNAFHAYHHLVRGLVVGSRIDYANPYRLLPSEPEAFAYLGLLTLTVSLFIVQGLAVLTSLRATKNVLGSRRLAWLATLVVFLAAVPFDGPIPPATAGWGLEAEALLLLFAALYVLKGLTAYRTTVRVVVFSLFVTLLAHQTIQAEFHRARLEETVDAAKQLFSTHTPASQGIRLQGKALEIVESAEAVARDRGVDEDLALALWASSSLAEGDVDCHIVVADDEGRILSEFAVNMPPLSWYGDFLVEPPAMPEEGKVAEVPGRGAGQATQFFVVRRTVPVEGLGWVLAIVPDSSSPFYQQRDLPRLEVGESPISSGLLTVPYYTEYDRQELIRTTDPAVSLHSTVPREIRDRFEIRPDDPTVFRHAVLEESFAGQERLDVYAPNYAQGELVGYFAVGFQPATSRERFYHFLVLFVLMAAATLLTILFFTIYARVDPRGARRPQRAPRFGLEGKIVAAFLVVAILPTAMVGTYAQRRASGRLRERVESEIQRAMDVVDQRIDRVALARATASESLLASAFQGHVDRIAEEIGHVVLVYRDDRLVGTNQEFLVQTGRFTQRLPGRAYAGIVLGGRRSMFREVEVASTGHLVGYRPILSPRGEVVGTIAIPALYRQREIEREYVESSSMIFSIFFCMNVAMIVLAMVIARWIAHPVRLLMEGTSRIAGGDLDFELPPRADDELGELVQSFNRMTRELKASRERLVKAERDAAWREMAKQIAHEIKNPLTPMKLTAQSLRRAHARGTADFDRILGEGVDMIVKQIDALSRIATEFSNFAKFPQRRLEPVRVLDLVEGAIAVFCPPAEDRIRGNVRVVRDLEGADFEIKADRDEIARVLINLITNGVQAMEGTGGTLTVSARRARFVEAFDPTALDRLEGDPGGIERDADVAVLEVADTGAGMTGDVLAKIFEPNFSTKSSGTGLGLAISRKSVTEMRGLIGLSTRPGEGTRFVVILPTKGEGVITRVREIKGDPPTA